MSPKNKEIDVAQIKCAHRDCNCVVDVNGGVTKDGRIYCSELCASGQGCSHRGCGCGSMLDDERYRHEGGHERSAQGHA